MADPTQKVGDAVPGRAKDNLCQPCSKMHNNNVADVFCEDCAEYQCNECAKVHKVYSVMSKHKLVPASEGSIMYDMKGLDQCAKHQEPLKFICEDHNKLCCSTCVIAGHRKCHSVEDIEEKAKVEIPDFTDLKKELFDIESKVNAFVKQATKTSEKLKTGFNDVIDQLQQMQNKINNIFEELKRNLTKGLNNFQKRAQNEFRLNQMSCERTTAEVKQSLSDIDDIIQKSTAAQKLIMSYHLTDKLKQLQAKTLNEYGELKDVIVSFRFEDSMSLPPPQNFIPGKLTAMFVPYTADSKDRAQQRKHKVNLKLLASIDLKQGEGDVNGPFYTGIDFLKDGRVVAVDNMNKKCVVYDMKLQTLGSLQLSFVPLGVVALSDEELAVTCASTFIQILNVSTNNEITCTRSVKVTHKYNSVCMMDTEHLLVGCIDNTQPIRVISLSGEEEELGVNFPDKTYGINDSRCTYVKNNNKVILTDRHAHTVYIYDLFSNTRVDVKEEKIIKEPGGVAVGPGDCMFFCSENTNSIVQISHEGQIVSSHVLDMMYPYSVCVSKDMTKLAVANCATGKMKLHVYEIEIQSD